jgi:hypothetical protein
MNVNISGKILFGTLACALENGGMTNLKIQGDPIKIISFIKVLLATKNYQNELKEPFASIESISTKLIEKNQAAKEFELIMGVAWPL